MQSALKKRQNMLRKIPRRPILNNMDTEILGIAHADYLPEAEHFKVRAAHSEDLDRLSEIDAACFPPGIAYPRDYLQHLLTSPTSIARVAELVSPLSPTPTICGFSVLEIRTRAMKIVGELVTIDVLPEVQRKGVGQLLHASVERATRQRGGHKLRLQVSVENAAAIRFYEQLGYRTRGRIPKYYMDSIDAWWMEKSWK